jgi:hypothetical protein
LRQNPHKFHCFRCFANLFRQFRVPEPFLCLPAQEVSVFIPFLQGVKSLFQMRDLKGSRDPLQNIFPDRAWPGSVPFPAAFEICFEPDTADPCVFPKPSDDVFPHPFRSIRSVDRTVLPFRKRLFDAAEYFLPDQRIGDPLFLAVAQCRRVSALFPDIVEL